MIRLFGTLTISLPVPMAKAGPQQSPQARGLTLLPSKTGNTKRWQRTNKEQPQARQGRAEEQAPAAPRRQWVDKIPGLPDDTQQHFKPGGHIVKVQTPKGEQSEYVGGTWTPERAKLHEEIRSKAFDHVPSVPESDMPVAIVMMGGSASGKSTGRRRLGHDDNKFVLLDADDIKTHLPEYNQAVAGSARNAAAMVHEESSEVMKQIRDMATSSRKNLVMDGTGKNAKAYAKFMEELKAKGYHVHLVMTDLDVETAKQRAADRAEKEGRLIPPHFIDEAYKEIPPNFIPLTKHAHAFTLFDSRRRPPPVVWERKDGNEHVHDSEFVARFRAAHYGEDGGNMAMKKAVAPPKKPNVSHDDITRFLSGAMEDNHKRLEQLPKAFDRADGFLAVEDDKAFE